MEKTTASTQKGLGKYVMDMWLWKFSINVFYKMLYKNNS